MLKFIKKALHVLIYRNRYFIPLVGTLLAFIGFFLVSFVSKLEAKKKAVDLVKFEQLSDFDVPVDVMEKILKAVCQNDSLNEDFNFVSLISLLSAKYDGKLVNFKENDLKKLVHEFGKGKTEQELSKPYKNYFDFKQFYDALLCELVGPFRISKRVDAAGEPVFENKFGIKSYFPIAYDFETTVVDNFEKENSHLSYSNHLGVDLASKTKTPIIAVESGVVKESGKNKEFGWQLSIESFDGKRTYFYSNCYEKRPFTENITPNTVVKAGQVIGYVGATSCCGQKVVRPKNCPHLHFGVRLNLKSGFDIKQLWINPLKLLQFLQHHKSVVTQKIKNADFESKYYLVDPSYETYLKKQQN